MIKVLFMGTPEFAVPALQAIHSTSSMQVLAVYTQPDRPAGRGLGQKAPPVKTKAQELGFPVFQPTKLSGKDKNTEAKELENLKSLNPDVIVVVAYGEILRNDLIAVPRLGCINIHSSLLPRWRGAAPIQWAILNGDKETGVTTMRISEKLDAGDILLQAKLEIGPKETAQSLHDRLSQKGAQLIVPTLEGIAAGTINPIKQDESKVTFAPKLTKDMEWLDPAEDARLLDRKIRALNPWPGTSVIIEGMGRLRILQAEPVDSIQGREATIFEKAGMLLIATKQGSLRLSRIQLDGKKPVNEAQFLNGLKGQGKDLPLTIKKP